jgi:predicted nucleic acid-binding protein
VDYVVLDTDVASLSFRGRLASPMSTLLAGKVTCITFVTIGEMTKWAELRDWGRLDLWLSHQVQLGYDLAVAQAWGRLAAAGQRRSRTTPVNDTWITACRLAEGLPLATFNTKDYTDFVDNHGLRVVGLDRSSG